MKFQKGNKGRPKGTKSRFTTLKASFLTVYERIGGVDGLEAWVNESRLNRRLFYQWITRLLPQEQQHSGEIAHILSFDFGENGGTNGNGNGHEDNRLHSA